MGQGRCESLATGQTRQKAFLREVCRKTPSFSSLICCLIILASLTLGTEVALFSSEMLTG